MESGDAGISLAVSWEKDAHATCYLMRHLGKSTGNYWVSVNAGDFNFEDSLLIAHSIDVEEDDSHLVQIRAQYGDFKSEWSSVKATPTKSIDSRYDYNV